MKFLSAILILLFLSRSVHATDVASNFLINNRAMYQILQQLHTNHLDSVDRKWIDLIRFYKTFYTEAKALDDHCKRAPRAYYKDRWEREKVAKSMVSTLQMIILKTSISAIGQYANALDLSNDEYHNLYENAINYSCSKNTTVMSFRRIRKLFRQVRDLKFTLPTLNGNPLYTEKISQKQTREEKLINELYYTVGLFQSACSWGQSLDDLRLLQGLMQNEVIAAYVIRQMTSLKIKSTDSKNNEYMAKDYETTKVYCDGLICREKSYDKFIEQFPRSGGSFSIVGDLKAVYCNDFKNYKPESTPDLDPNLLALKKKYEGDEHKRIIAQFIALITKLPDFNVWTKNRDTLESYLKMGVDLFWDKWAYQNVERLQSKASYEEPLILESVDKEIFLNPKKFSPKVVFDLNAGEFDSSVAMNGKLKFKFDIKILGKDLWWLFVNYKTGDTFDKEAVAKYDKLLKSYVIKDFQSYKPKFKDYLIAGDITDHIWKEIKSQLTFFDVYDFSIGEKEIYNIPVEINIGPFAIVYLKNKQLMSESLKLEKEREKRYDFQKTIDSMASDEKK